MTLSALRTQTIWTVIGFILNFSFRLHVWINFIEKEENRGWNKVLHPTQCTPATWFVSPTVKGQDQENVSSYVMYFSVCVCVYIYTHIIYIYIYTYVRVYIYTHTHTQYITCHASYTLTGITKCYCRRNSFLSERTLDYYFCNLLIWSVLPKKKGPFFYPISIFSSLT